MRAQTGTRASTTGKRMAVRVGLALLWFAGATPLAAQVWEPGDPLPPGAEAPQMLPEIAPAYDVPDAGPDARMTEMPVPPPAPHAVDRQDAPAAAPMEDDPEDFLCTRAPSGKVEAVPAPFDQWAVLVCTQAGQALVPVMDHAWVVHGATEPISILAMPPGAQAPTPGPGFDARYDVRFEALVGVEAKDGRRRFADELMAEAAKQTTSALPDYDAAWQLDAQSNIEEARYNLFFFVKDGEPRHIIACLRHCAEALRLDVLSGAAAAKVLER